jgi:hypothetical protein
MAHAQRAERAFSQTAISLAAAAVLAVVLTGIVAFSTLNLFGIAAPTGERFQAAPAVIESGRQWELERRQQMGDVDPVTVTGDYWERQRRQQSGDVD